MPSVGTMLPVMSLSSVDLPAPFRPMMPRRRSALNLEVDAAQRPELAVALASQQPEGIEEVRSPAREDLVHLPDPLQSDGGLRHSR